MSTFAGVSISKRQGKYDYKLIWDVYIKSKGLVISSQAWQRFNIQCFFQVEIRPEIIFSTKRPNDYSLGALQKFCSNLERKAKTYSFEIEAWAQIHPAILKVEEAKSLTAVLSNFL
jgi:hypothetical protein